MLVDSGQCVFNALALAVDIPLKQKLFSLPAISRIRPEFSRSSACPKSTRGGMMRRKNEANARSMLT